MATKSRIPDGVFILALVILGPVPPYLHFWSDTILALTVGLIGYFTAKGVLALIARLQRR